MRPSSTPSTKILPLLGFSSRIRRRTRVDLPAPEGPTRKRKSPSGTSRLTSRSASVPVGYVLWTWWKLITGRVAKYGVKTISCVSCCGVVRPRARGARSRAVYPKGPQGPSLSLRAKHWSNGGRLRRLRGISDSRDYPALWFRRIHVSRDYRPFGPGDRDYGPFGFEEATIVATIQPFGPGEATLVATIRPFGPGEATLVATIRAFGPGQAALVATIVPLVAEIRDYPVLERACAAAAAPAWPRRHRSHASMKGSISPSSTAWALPTSSPVRTSLTSVYGCRT